MSGFAFAALALFATAPHYTAEPAARPSANKIVLEDVIFYCGDTGCSAAKSASRPAIVCAALARKVGPLTRFSTGGAALTPAELEKCNASAG